MKVVASGSSEYKNIKGVPVDTVPVDTYEIRNGQPVKYIFAGTMRLARITGSTVQYYHKDHLGSSTLVTDASGNLLDSMVYEPFGQPRATCQPGSQVGWASPTI